MFPSDFFISWNTVNTASVWPQTHREHGMYYAALLMLLQASRSLPDQFSSRLFISFEGCSVLDNVTVPVFSVFHGASDALETLLSYSPD